jgi:Caspase domain
MASRAVIIGPSQYAEGSGLDPHPEIRQSAYCYGEMLRQDDLWGADRVEVVPEEGLNAVNDVMDVVQRAADQAKSGDTLMVVYVGHGAYWEDLPGSQVHFALNSSRRAAPYGWLSSWYIYRAMRRSKATLKVLIADCCYSNFLSALGDEDGELDGVLNEKYNGTCVLTAVKKFNRAGAEGCENPELPPELRKCTPFSGHLLNVLKKGSATYRDTLSLGVIRDAVRAEMAECNRHRDLPRMILNDASDDAPLFTNRRRPSWRDPKPVDPPSEEAWVSILMEKQHAEYDLNQLFADPGKTGRVVVALSRQAGEAGRIKALDVNERASVHFTEPDLFADYWAEAVRALPR